MKGNEEVDLLAKQSLKSQTIDLQVKLSKAEAKTKIKVHAQNLLQEYNKSEGGNSHYSSQNRAYRPQ